jgi:hypothetical protein
MIRRSFMFAAAFILLMLAVPACSSDNGVTPGMRGAGTLQGTVWDVASDSPLSGAVVTMTSVPFATDVSGTGKIALTTSTGADGRFLREDVPNGSVTVKVSHDGYRTPAAQTWALTPGGVGDLRFEMAPGEDPVPKFEGDEQSAWPPDYSE